MQHKRIFSIIRGKEVELLYCPGEMAANIRKSSTSPQFFEKIRNGHQNQPGEIEPPTILRDLYPPTTGTEWHRILNITLEHTAAITSLPFHHRDPSGRLLAIQAKIEKMPLISADPAFDSYEVERIW